MTDINPSNQPPKNLAGESEWPSPTNAPKGPPPGIQWQVPPQVAPQDPRQGKGNGISVNQWIAIGAVAVTGIAAVAALASVLLTGARGDSTSLAQASETTMESNRVTGSSDDWMGAICAHGTIYHGTLESYAPMSAASSCVVKGKKRTVADTIIINEYDTISSFNESLAVAQTMESFPWYAVAVVDSGGGTIFHATSKTYLAPLQQFGFTIERSADR